MFGVGCRMTGELGIGEKRLETAEKRLEKKSFR
jgi:hypothetical protein